MYKRQEDGSLFSGSISLATDEDGALVPYCEEQDPERTAERNASEEGDA